ncbi:MAG: hypothetical protein A2V70_06460 [Planctomycetes bacterium RBG_13_63_9]|nr:MAG: hypothetical protein A2V70_06460 [Planctomycetes bacterium RBG_13_63_9]
MDPDLAEPDARGRDVLTGYLVRAACRGAANETFGVGRPSQRHGGQAAGRGERSSTPESGAQLRKPGGPSLTWIVQTAAGGTTFDGMEYDPAPFAQPCG